MPNYQFIEVSTNESVGYITLNRPKTGNSITPEMGSEIIDALTTFGDNSSIRAVVFIGKGKFFCTGMDLGSSNQSNLEEDLKSGVAANRSFRLFESIKTFKKPTIALINGPVYGGGCGLVFVCDIRIAMKDSFLCFSEVRRGIVPALISAFIVPQLGEYLSNLYMMTGKKLPVEKLYQLGLVSNIVQNNDELLQLANDYITDIKCCGPNAVSSTKANVQFCAGNTHDENCKHVKQVFAKTVQSPEAMYGISCFLQRKQPDWSTFTSSSL